MTTEIETLQAQVKTLEFSAEGWKHDALIQREDLLASEEKAEALQEQVETLRKERDELLEALKRVCCGFPIEDESHWVHWAISEKTLSIVKEAIRKAGGDS